MPTPTSSDATEGPGNSGRQGGDNLRTAVAKMLPTPTANEAQNTTLPPSAAKWDSLPGELLRQQFTGQLNPAWVEWLMGWPCEWTNALPLPDTALECWMDVMAAGEWWLAEPPIPRVARGVKDRCERIRALGNGQVPLCAAIAWSMLFVTRGGRH